MHHRRLFLILKKGPGNDTSSNYMFAIYIKKVC